MKTARKSVSLAYELASDAGVHAPSIVHIADAPRPAEPVMGGLTVVVSLMERVKTHALLPFNAGILALRRQHALGDRAYGPRQVDVDA